MNGRRLTKEQTALIGELGLFPLSPNPGPTELRTWQMIEDALQECGLSSGRNFIIPPTTVVESSTEAIQVKGRYHAILAHVAAGQTQKEIAESMSMPPSTVGSRLYRVKRKLGVNSIAEAVEMFNQGRVVALENW